MINKVFFKYFAVIFAVGVLIFGIISTFLEFQRISDDDRFFDNALTVTAVCTKIEHNSSSRLSGTLYVHLKYDYRGHEYNTVSVLYSGDIHEGDITNAYILPDHPDMCRIQHIDRKRLYGCIAICIIGIITAVFSFFYSKKI